MRRGRFIALEGGEGSGKSTHARLLADALAKRGIVAVLTREPGGTPGAEAIRELLLHPPTDSPNGGWNARAEALLFAAARSDHVDKLIRPALERGEWVICDRFVDSSRAYQGGASELGDAAVNALHDFGSGGIRPDVTLLLTVPPGLALERLSARDKGRSDAIGGRGAEYHGQVAAAFRDLAERDPHGFRVIDGAASREEVHARVLAAIAPMLGELG